MVKKDDKIYEEHNVELNLTLSSRGELMKKAVQTFISEKPGYWKDGRKQIDLFIR